VLRQTVIALPELNKVSTINDNLGVASSFSAWKAAFRWHPTRVLVWMQVATC
jgi:hypothetical protein